MHMNNNTTMWAYRCISPSDSEFIQRTAFTFGYSWGDSTKEPKHVEEPYLFFNPDDKCITFGTQNIKADTYASEVVLSHYKALDLFKNPPTKGETGFTYVHTTKIFKDGTVVDANGTFMTAREFDFLVAERDKYLGRKKMYPVISFEYRRECSTFATKRTILVVECTDTFVEGYELIGNNKGTYKRFLLTRMSMYPIFSGFKSVD